MFYSANWQLVEERIDDDYLNNAGVNRRFQYIWGPRYIDDLVLRRLDGNADGDFADVGAIDKVYCHRTDAQFSTVAVNVIGCTPALTPCLRRACGWRRRGSRSGVR